MRIALGQIDMGFEEKEKTILKDHDTLQQAACRGKGKTGGFCHFPRNDADRLYAEPRNLRRGQKKQPLHGVFPRRSKEKPCCHLLWPARI